MLKRVHLITGIVALIMFSISGIYMTINFPAIYQGNEAIHMMFRANHIYILFIGLINFILGSLLIRDEQLQWRAILGSTLLIMASLLFIIAFFIEPLKGNFIRSFTSLAILLTAVGTLFHAAAAFKKR